MVFQTTNLFKGITCPEGEKCRLTNCIFAHNLQPKEGDNSIHQISQTLKKQNVEVKPVLQAATQKHQDESARATEPPAKRRKITTVQSTHAYPSGSAPRSLDRPVSPPTKTNTRTSGTEMGMFSSQAKSHAGHAFSAKGSQGNSTAPLETLNPRLIANDPVGHSKRSVLLRLLHKEMVRLNDGLVARQKEAGPQFKPGLVLDQNEVVKLALDEEEGLAKGKKDVYMNVIKNRIAAYKKMKQDEWIVHLKSTSLFQAKIGMTAKPSSGPTLDAPKEIVTGLSPAEELAVAKFLVVRDQKLLAPFGYIPTPPTAKEATEAAAAVEASKNYEICDRCSARFQVFPDRDSEGRLTSNGPCRYHPKKKIYPQRTKADIGPREAYYPCCHELVGSVGCTVAEWHVYKAATPARLAAVMPFINTPENGNPMKDKHGRRVEAVAFDCEMGYTTLGLELIRLTAVSWPHGEALLDCLVRPLGTVLDLNSQFSGVWPEDMANAVPYTSKDGILSPIPPPQPDGSSSSSPPPPSPALPMAKSPQQARALLCAFLTPSTPLIGHAIENDLNATRLCHPTIIDTAIIFPHFRGLPFRYGLKMLSYKHLGRNIQQEGAGRGHDSLEDARATGDLVRWNVKERWNILKAQGWHFSDGKLAPPPLGPGKKGEVEIADELLQKALGGKRNSRESGNGNSIGSLKQSLDRGLKRPADDEKQNLTVAYLEDGSEEDGNA
ncbi:MAG: hypothetical protein FE78DRAFT_136215 [Acidomyces sp. 'richmondensis']|nr:MAG: hypothetical protein FE78DRAFT_136215 [Acidomyces sp. 'richmondensis']